MDWVRKLSNIYREYELYPIKRFESNSPVRVFQSLFPDNYYSKEIDGFLNKHTYEPSWRGADLPWWGQKYFSEDTAVRTLIVSQNSTALDAGSIVMFACLMPLLNSEAEYAKFVKQLNRNQNYKFSSWRKIKDTIESWQLDWNYLYITDAKKVHKRANQNTFDNIRSKELLYQEIEFCDPDFVILFGQPPLELVDKSKKYSECVVGNNVFSQNGRTFIIAPFPSGQSPSQPTYNSGMQSASRYIRELIVYKR